MIQAITKQLASVNLKFWGLAALAFTVLILINYGLYRLIALISGKLLSFALIIALYYFNARKIVRAIAFPGTTILLRRQLESDFCTRMAQGVLQSIIDLKNCIDIFMGPIP